MSELAIKTELTGTVEQICEKVTEALKPIGFGILTRIDFDQKIKEKINETILRVGETRKSSKLRRFQGERRGLDIKQN